MSQITVNPYDTIGTGFSNGLATFIGTYGTAVTMAQLLAEVATIIDGSFYRGLINTTVH